MIIQHILFPSRAFDPVPEAYVRVNGETNYGADIAELVMSAGAEADFDTYFNGFSVEKWRKYTRLGCVCLHLELEGEFTVVIYNEYRLANKNVREEIDRVNFSGGRAEGNVALDIALPERSDRGIYGFTLICRGESGVFRGGWFYTRQEDTFPSPCFAIDICTYRREKFVKRNMDLLRDEVFCEGSPLKDAFEVFISDNGKSLDLKSDYGGKVHVYPNKNAGGAGGFGRGMIEILCSPDYEKFTHIIMMDDDIVFNFETLYRTYMMAKLLRPEYKNAFIGGSMLCLDKPAIQSEALDRWDVTGHSPVKYRYDITDLSYVLKNEIEDKGNYFGWWYCVMPIGVVKSNNLPLPLFIKRDDIEYGIRNGRTFINLNGLCVLHESFGNKRNGYLEYYYWRNICILNALHFPSYTKEKLKRQLFKLVATHIARYRYDDANLALAGVEDFLRGIDWLKTTDAEELNDYVMNYTYRAVPVQEIPPAFAHGQYEKCLSAGPAIRDRVMKKPGKSLFRKVIYGWLLPAKGTRYVRMNDPELYFFYRVKRIINYDESSGTAFVTYKSWRELFNLLRNFRRVCKLINKKYDAVRLEYKARAREITGLGFWVKYLGMDGSEPAKRDFASESVVLSSKALREKRRNAALRKLDAKHLRRVRLYRFIQAFLTVVMPIKRNRVCFYLHQRKGYTCNLKYITEQLLKEYGNRAEIVWITKYPATCSSLVKRGIRVVKYGTFAHWYYQFTSKVVVVNDAFPESVLLRRRQFTINTWHASMNYKKIGPASVKFVNDIARKVFMIRNKQPQMYVSGSAYFTEDTSRSFGFDKKVFVPFGMPRNDIFFRDPAPVTQKVKKRYALPSGCKLVLYAPTFRDGYKEDIFGIDFGRLTEALRRRFGGEWKVLYRKHYFVNAKDVILDRNTYDVSDYDDMNELLVAADVLISDYSSCLWDFSITKRPSFVYATDIDKYHSDDRDFSYPLEKWPYPIARNNDELEAAILSFDTADYAAKVEEHHRDGGIYDDGHASERVADVIVKQLKLK